MSEGHRLDRADVLLAAAALVVQLSSAWIVSTQWGEPSLTIAAVGVTALSTVPVAWRRRAPMWAWALTGIGAVWYGMAKWPDPVFLLGPVVALATVVERCPRRTAAIASGASIVVVVAASLLTADTDAVDWWRGLAYLGLAIVVGDRQRARRRYLEELQDRAQRLERDRLRAIRDAQVAERNRLARELHDVVAHNVTMMVVQAEAGASTTAEADSTTTSAFDDIADTGRQALLELRRLLGILRSDGDPMGTAPQPGVGDLTQLVAQVRATGVDVDLDVSGTTRPLSPAVDLSAYRVVQEALTNVVKHSQGSRAHVHIDYGGDSITIVVRDDGRGAATAANGKGDGGRGFGLEGLRERVNLLGGTLDTRHAAGGGFELDVRLPLDARP